MRIESNVAAVMARVSRLKNRDIPLALSKALHPNHWREPARKEAQAALEALARPTERQYIAEFIRTLLVEVFAGTGFLMRLRSPFQEVKTLADYQAARGAVNATDFGQNLFSKGVTEFEELIREWVETEKHKDQRDTGKSDEEIANFISYLMLTPNPTRRELEARKSLMPHIVDFLQRKQAAARLDAVTVDLWLRAVLAAWGAMVRTNFPEIFHEELKVARNELGLETRKAA